MILDNLFFVPLAIPDPPEVDQQKLVDYAVRWKRHCSFIKKDSYYNKLLEYPWEEPIQPFRPSIIDKLPPNSDPKILQDLVSKNIAVSKIELELREEFKQLFPEIVEYASTHFPFKMNAMTILFQRQNIEVSGHTDADDEWAFRFYLWNNFQDNALWFRTPKDPTLRFPANTLTNDYSKFNDPIYVKFPKKEYTPWAFNSYKTIHGVHAGSSDESSRCAIIVRGIMDEEKMKDLLIRSVEKYPEYACFI